MLQLKGIGKLHPYIIKYENVLLPIPSQAYKINGRCEIIGEHLHKGIYDNVSGEVSSMRHRMRGKISELIENNNNIKIVIKIKKHKRVTDDENKNETIKKVLELVDFRKNKVKDGIMRSFYYNFTEHQLKKLLNQDTLKYITPNKFTMSSWHDSIFLKIDKKFYEI